MEQITIDPSVSLMTKGLLSLSLFWVTLVGPIGQPRFARD